MMYPNATVPQPILADYGISPSYGAMTVKARPGIVGRLSLGYAATAKNLRRLKLKLRKLEDELHQKVAATRWAGRKKRLKRRYARRIERAQKRIDRIERVMIKRTERRAGKGKDLTRRQRKLMALLKHEKHPTRRRHLEDAIDAEDGIDIDAELDAADADLDLTDEEGGLIPAASAADPFYLHPAFLIGFTAALTGGVLFTVLRRKRRA